MASLKRVMAATRLARANGLFSERKRLQYTLYNNNNSMDEIYNFRDKHLKEYRVKNTNISVL